MKRLILVFVLLLACGAFSRVVGEWTDPNDDDLFTEFGEWNPYDDSRLMDQSSDEFIKKAQSIETFESLQDLLNNAPRHSYESRIAKSILEKTLDLSICGQLTIARVDERHSWFLNRVCGKYTNELLSVLQISPHDPRILFFRMAMSTGLYNGIIAENRVMILTMLQLTNDLLKCMIKGYGAMDCSREHNQFAFTGKYFLEMETKS